MAKDFTAMGISLPSVLDFIKTHSPKQLYAMIVSNSGAGFLNRQERYKAVYDIKIDGRMAIIKLE